MNMKRRFYLLEQAGDAGDPGAGGTVDAAAAPAAPAAAAQAPDQTALQAAAAAAAPGVPDKFQVKKEDGSLDVDATLAKLAESYAAAEKRIGSGDIPPKNAAEYQIAVPKSLEGAWDPAADPTLAAFTEKALAAGFTQKQMDLVIEQYGELAPGLVKGTVALDAETCTTELRSEWKTTDEFEKNTGLAVDGLKNYAGEDADDLMARYGNDAKFIRMMAKIGAETAEDGAPKHNNPAQGESINELINSEAYRNPSDPQHAAISAKVAAHYEAQAAAAAKTGSAPYMG